MNLYNMTNQIIKKLFIAAAFFTVYNAWGQDDFAYLEKIIPPSPTAASLGTYGNVPINLSNGSPNISLPIYTMQAKNGSISIDIAYNSNGVQTDGVPGQLGVDWSLQVGGAVTRTLYDEDDLDNVNHFIAQGDFCYTGTVEGLEFSSADVDTQADIFNYNAMGVVSGTFVLDENKQPQQLEYSDNKIEFVLYPGPNGSNYKGFKITDTSGTQYFFGENNVNETSYIGGGQSPSYETAWFLTSVKYASGEIINFNYSEKDFLYISAYNQTATASVEWGNAHIFNLGTDTHIIERHYTQYLSQILFNGHKIDFEYVEHNTDITSIYNEPEQLKAISVFGMCDDSNGACNQPLVRKFEFNYYEFPSNASSSVNNSHTNPDIERIFLKEVIEYDEELQNSFKKYAFDYQTPENLPPRHSFSKDIYGYYNESNNTNLIYKNWGQQHDEDYEYEYSFSLANRNPIGNADGMLHHIYYPTGGDTEFIYEPNVIQTEEMVYPPLTTIQIELIPDSNPNHHIREVFSDPFTSPFDQTGIFYAYGDIILDTEGCEHYINPDGSSNFPNAHAQFNAYLKNSTGTTLASMTYSESLNGPINVPLETDVTYQLSFRTSWDCTGGVAYIKLYAQEPYTQTVEKPIGGVRVSKTIDHDNNGNENSKRYYYGDLTDLEKSSVSYNTYSPNYLLNIDFLTNVQNNNTQIKGIIYSTSKTPLYDIHGRAFSYAYVTESLGGDNFEKGGIEHKFSVNPSNIPGQVCGDDFVRGTPFSNPHNYSRELRSKTFKKEGSNYIPTSVTEYGYEQKNIGQFIIENLSYNVYKVFNMGFSANYFNILQYELSGEAWYLKSSKNTVYDFNGANPVETTITYNYDSPDHMQLKSQTVQTNTNEKRITKYEYPPDLIGIEQSPYMQDLTDANRIGTPVKTETYVEHTEDIEKLSEEHIKYGNNTNTGNLLLPVEVYSRKGDGSINLGSIEDRKVTYTKYASNGNILEYKLENGTPVSIIWGYNDQYPIAKIEGAQYSEVLSYITDLHTAITNGTLSVSSFDDMRDDLSEALVTGYIYKPLVGVTTITYPNRSTEYYEYDDFGRLKQVKNAQNEVIKKMEYHYQTP